MCHVRPGVAAPYVCSLTCAQLAAGKVDGHGVGKRGGEGGRRELALCPPSIIMRERSGSSS